MKKLLICLLLISLISVFGIGVIHAVGTSPTLDPSMVLYYKFNNDSSVGENDTNVYDFSGNGNNGTANNTQFQAGTGILGDGSFYFNGVNSKIITKVNGTSGFYSNLAYTYHVWINFTLNQSNTAIITKGPNAFPYNQLEVVSTGKIRFKIRNSTYNNEINSKISLNDSKYHMVNAVYNGSHIFLYIDGINQDTPVLVDTGGRDNSTYPIIIGSNSDNNAYFNGTIDEVIIYNRSLSSLEVGQLFFTYNPNYIDINTCGVYNNNFTIYNITTNLYSSGSCINSSSRFSTFNGNGYNINFGTFGDEFKWGILLDSNSYSTTILNFSIISLNYTNAYKYAIYNLGDYNNLLYNYINISGWNDAYGIYLLSSDYNTIYYNNIYSFSSLDLYGGDGWNIPILASNYNNISFNNLYSFGKTTEGIVLQSSNFNLVYNNYINNSVSEPLRIYGNDINNYNNSIINNYYLGKKINYSFNTHNQIIINSNFTELGQYIFGYCFNLTIYNNSFYTGGITISNVSNSNISNNYFYIPNSSVNFDYRSDNNFFGYNFINTSSSYALNLYSNNNNSFYYNYFYNYNDNHNYSEGVELFEPSNLSFYNNYIETHSNYGYGYIGGGYNHSIFNNIFVLYGDYGIPISFSRVSTSSFIYNNNITCYGNCLRLTDFSRPSNLVMYNNSYLSLMNLSAFNIRLIYGNNSNISFYNVLYNFVSPIYALIKSNSFFTSIYNYNDSIVSNISISNTSGLIVWTSNGTQLNTNTNTVLNYSLYPFQRIYVYYNLYLIEGDTTTFPDSPLWFSSSSSTSKHIASNLSESVNVSVIVNVESCDSLGSIYYTPKDGTKTKISKSQYSCSGNQVTFTSLQINPSDESNVLEFSYECSTYTRTGNSLIMISFAILIIGGIVFYLYRNGWENVSLGSIVLMGIVVIIGAIIFASSGQNLGANCPVT